MAAFENKLNPSKRKKTFSKLIKTLNSDGAGREDLQLPGTLNAKFEPQREVN